MQDQFVPYLIEIGKLEDFFYDYSNIKEIKMVFPIVAPFDPQRP
jgi:hypothetical protein